MNTRKRVFVTGASSELLLQVLSKVDKNEFEIIGLTRSQHPPCKDLISWVRGDIQEPESYKHIIAGCSIIIHAAAVTHTRAAAQYFKTNVDGTRKLIKSIPKGVNPRFVFISSRVAGENSGAYGVSKLRAEREVQQRGNWLIIRPSEIFGGSKNEGIEKMILSGIKGGVQLAPVGMKSKMFPIHLSDSAEVIYKSVFVDEEKNCVIQLNGKKGYSFKELLLLIQNVSGSKMFIVPIPKWTLQLVAFAAKIIPIDIGFVPDQVDRLYAEKEHGLGIRNCIELKDYIRQKTPKIKT